MSVVKKTKSSTNNDQSLNVNENEGDQTRPTTAA